MQKQKIRIRLKAFDYKLIDQSALVLTVSIWELVAIAFTCWKSFAAEPASGATENLQNPPQGLSPNLAKKPAG